ncbi:hypothetical protein AWENTII_003875 [Aspergillus wentii]
MKSPSKQSAVVLHCSYEREFWGDDPIPGQAEVSEDMIWWKWRVSLNYACTFWNSVEGVEDTFIGVYSRPECLDPDGVIQPEVPENVMPGETEDPNKE